MFKYLLDTSDDERGYVEFSPDDAVAILVNNMGGLSDLELAALADVALLRLGTLLASNLLIWFGHVLRLCSSHIQDHSRPSVHRHI